MTTSKVTKLVPESRQAMIDAARKILDMAESGELVAIAGCLVGKDREVTTVREGLCDVADIVYGLRAVEFRVIRENCEEELGE